MKIRMSYVSNSSSSSYVLSADILKKFLPASTVERFYPNGYTSPHSPRSDRRLPTDEELEMWEYQEMEELAELQKDEEEETEEKNAQEPLFKIKTFE